MIPEPIDVECIRNPSSERTDSAGSFTERARAPPLRPEAVRRTSQRRTLLRRRQPGCRLSRNHETDLRDTCCFGQDGLRLRLEVQEVAIVARPCCQQTYTRMASTPADITFEEHELSDLAGGDRSATKPCSVARSS